MVITTYLNRNRKYKYTDNESLVPSRKFQQWQNSTFVVNIFVNFTKINTFKHISFDIERHQIIEATIGCLITQLGLKLLSLATDTKEGGANSRRVVCAK